MATTYANGRIPDSALVRLQYASSHRLRADAADAWNRVNADFKARTAGRGLHASDGTPGINLDLTDSYRPYDVQERIFLQRYDHTRRSGLTVGNGGIKYWKGRTWYKRPGFAVAATPGTVPLARSDRWAVDAIGCP